MIVEFIAARPALTARATLRYPTGRCNGKMPRFALCNRSLGLQRYPNNDLRLQKKSASRLKEADRLNQIKDCY